jgi:hypothetical protein
MKLRFTCSAPVPTDSSEIKKSEKHFLQSSKIFIAFKTFVHRVPAFMCLVVE